VRTLEEIEVKKTQLENVWAKVKWQLARSVILMILFAIALMCYYQYVYYKPAMKYWQYNSQIPYYEEYLHECKDRGEEPDAGILSEYELLRNEKVPIVLPTIGYMLITAWFFISILLLPPRIKPHNLLRYLRPIKELVKQFSPAFSETQVRLEREKLAANRPLSDRLKRFYPYIVVIFLGIYYYISICIFWKVAEGFFRQGFNPLIHSLMINQVGMLLVMTVCLLKSFKFKTKREAKLEILAWIAHEPAEELDKVMQA